MSRIKHQDLFDLAQDDTRIGNTIALYEARELSWEQTLLKIIFDLHYSRTELMKEYTRLIAFPSEIDAEIVFTPKS